ncbi:MAG: hypothetical protein KME21_28885 [Desmonostoc vinosum HA7617-LM4]|nr:hypothetical protein [Desmonostoc vinosum HA7617-LM4]
MLLTTFSADTADIPLLPYKSAAAAHVPPGWWKYKQLRSPQSVLVVSLRIAGAVEL